jgi:hypothetical protein
MEIRMTDKGRKNGLAYTLGVRVSGKGWLEMPHKIPGEFVPLSSTYDADPAILEVGYRAELLYIRMIAWSKRLRWGGRVHRAMVSSIAHGIPAINECVSRLLAANLLREDGDYLAIVAWRKWNTTEEEYQEAKEEKRMAGIVGSHARWHKEKPSPDCPICRGEVVEE